MFGRKGCTHEIFFKKTWSKREWKTRNFALVLRHKTFAPHNLLQCLGIKMLDWYISTSVRLLQLNTPFLRIKKPSSSFPHLKIEIPSSSPPSFANGSSARRLRRQSGKRKLHTEMTLRKTKSLFFCDSGGWARRRRELVFILAPSLLLPHLFLQSYFPFLPCTLLVSYMCLFTSDSGPRLRSED